MSIVLAIDIKYQIPCLLCGSTFTKDLSLQANKDIILTMKIKKTVFIFIICVMLAFTGCYIRPGLYDSPGSASSVPTEVTAPPQLPHGSADSCEGIVAVVSVFVSTPTYSWDFTDPDDKTTISHTLNYLKLGTSWIESQAASWNKFVDFKCDWTVNPSLYYEAKMSDEILNNSGAKGIEEVWQYIAGNLAPIDDIKAEYGASSVVYMLFINTPSNYNRNSCTIVCDEGFVYPYEFCRIYCNSIDGEENPASYAHEILHTFGAPDLYKADDFGNNYGTTDELVAYVSENLPNEIMNATYDIETGLPYYDKISNELTEITAYYIGWTDKSEVAEAFGLEPTKH